MTDRYWGGSSPFAQLNTSNLQYLTVQQAMSDFTNFASNASLPFDSGNASNAANVVSGIYGSPLTVSIAKAESSAVGILWHKLCGQFGGVDGKTHAGYILGIPRYRSACTSRIRLLHLYVFSFCLSRSSFE